MIHFPKIKSFDNAVRAAHCMNGDSETTPVRSVYTYWGTVKIHGTNAGVRVDPDGTVTPQSRNRILSVGSDNNGFAAWALDEKNKTDLERIASIVRFEHTIVSDDVPVWLFGEWCGPGINKGCGIHKIPERVFVIFNWYAESFGFHSVDPEFLQDVDNDSIYCTENFRCFGPVYIDYNDSLSIAKAKEVMFSLTDEVEAECPVAKEFGASGIGEGIVWVDFHDTAGDLWIKTKGAKHRETGPRPKRNNRFDLEQVQAIRDFVEYALVPARLEKGIEFLKEMGKPLDKRSTGYYIRWAIGDVTSELASDMDGLNVSMVNSELSRMARTWYFSYVEDTTNA